MLNGKDSKGKYVAPAQRKSVQPATNSKYAFLSRTKPLHPRAAAMIDNIIATINGGTAPRDDKLDFCEAFGEAVINYECFGQVLDRPPAARAPHPPFRPLPGESPTLHPVRLPPPRR